jgi:hypothetical protein
MQCIPFGMPKAFPSRKVLLLSRPHGIGMIMHAPSPLFIHVLPFQRTPNHEKSIQYPLLFVGGGKRVMGEQLSRRGVLGGTVQVVLALTTDVAHVSCLRGLGGGLAQASRGGVTG